MLDLPPEVDKKLVDKVLKLAEIFFGIAANDAQDLAFQAGKQNISVKNPEKIKY